jgi:hypothetical protein
MYPFAQEEKVTFERDCPKTAYPIPVIAIYEYKVPCLVLVVTWQAM